MTKIGLIQFLLFFLISAAWGQKAKYKDIYALLSTKQFEQAEPFLRAYLRENTTNPNAYLFMGTIFQEKASRNDVLKQTETAIANMDSAILYYEKAMAMVDDRELRKNKGYYQDYNRRDLRTGEFGVKLSDIQFDISKKIEALQERIASVKMVKHYFSLADSAYRQSNAVFVSLQQRFASENQLFLRADEDTRQSLTTLALQFDACVKAFEHYKSATSHLGKTGYNQQVLLGSIDHFPDQGGDASDFYADQVRLWDYKQFAVEALAIIDKEVLPMRAHLVAYDTEINKLRDRLNADSVSVRTDLTELIDKILYDQMRKFDPEPLPMFVFALKTTDLAYRSLMLEHKPLRDSANIHLQVNVLRDELELLKKLDSAAALLTEEKLVEKGKDYAVFIGDTYSDISVLNKYVRAVADFVAGEEIKKSAQLANYLTALEYIVDGADSIPLSRDVVSRWRPLSTTPEKFTIGLCLQDSTRQLSGYFYTITPSRTPDVKALFPVDDALFSPDKIDSTNALAYSDAGEQIYYVLLYSAKAQKEKFAATLAKIYRSDGLAWKKELPLSFAPTDINLTADTGDLVISSATQKLVVDKNGKVLP